MTWVRIDDHLHSHPKFKHAWSNAPASVGLELFALSYSAAHLTDGQVDPRFVSEWFPKNTRGRRRAVDALVDSGLWVPNGDGWQIHDYLDYNEPRERVLALRERRAMQRKSRRGS